MQGNGLSREAAFLDRIGGVQLRPSEFTGRFARRRRGIGWRKRRARHRARLAASTLALAAIPVLGTQGSLAAFDLRTPFEIHSAGVQGTRVDPMPFEQPGTSFPGSAFYYLEMKETRTGTGAILDAAAATADKSIGPAARAFAFRGTGSAYGMGGLDRSRALQCLTAAIYYEAASEPDAGQRAVAQVVLNRVAHPAYPATVCGVVYEGSERATGCQFSFTCDGALKRKPAPYFWARAQSVARDALAGIVYAPVGLATHYHTLQVNPYWAPGLHYLTTIGAHRFYSFAGRAGSLGTFRFVYGGGEPVAAPHARLAGPESGTTLDPLALQAAFATGAATPPAVAADAAPLDPARASGLDRLPQSNSHLPGTPPPAAVEGAPKLPDSQGIRPEYRNSGQWIAKPGS